MTEPASANRSAPLGSSAPRDTVGGPGSAHPPEAGDPRAGTRPAARGGVDIYSFLRRIPLFADLRPEELRGIAGIVRRRRYPKGSIIFTQDSVGDVAFIVLRGRVEIVLHSPDGRDFILHEAFPADYFGELALLDRNPRSASAIAVEDTDVLVLQRNEFLEEIQKQPRVMLRMLQALSQRLRTADEKIKSLAFSNVATRLKDTLLQLSAQDPTGTSRVVRTSQEDLASMIGSSRQTVNQLLNGWQRKGLVTIAREKITILKPEQLARDYLD